MDIEKAKKYISSTNNLDKEFKDKLLLLSSIDDIKQNILFYLVKNEKESFIKILLENIVKIDVQSVKNIVKKYLIESENNPQIKEILSLSNEKDIQKYVKKTYKEFNMDLKPLIDNVKKNNNNFD